MLTVPWFWGEVKGYSLLYEGLPTTAAGWVYFFASIPLFLLFTDFGIYWIHRWLHLPSIYKHLHKVTISFARCELKKGNADGKYFIRAIKPHHKWVVPTPFASHAFHPLDGYLQSVPYHLFVYLFPMQKWLYISMFVFVNCWTVMIHDGKFSNSIQGGWRHKTLTLRRRGSP